MYDEKYEQKYGKVLRVIYTSSNLVHDIPDSKVHGANMGPTWVLSAPDGPHVRPMNFANWDVSVYRSKCRF